MANQSGLIPTGQKIIDDQGKADLRWVLFFQQLLNGDQGLSFKPDVENLASTGQPTYAGVYFQNQGFIDWYVTITPATNTSSTAGTTYIQLPFAVAINAPCFATNGNTASAGGIVATTNRAYLPSWSNLATPVTVSGRVRTQ